MVDYNAGDLKKMVFDVSGSKFAYDEKSQKIMSPNFINVWDLNSQNNINAEYSEKLKSVFKAISKGNNNDKIDSVEERSALRQLYMLLENGKLDSDDDKKLINDLLNNKNDSATLIKTIGQAFVEAFGKKSSVYSAEQQQIKKDEAAEKQKAELEELGLLNEEGAGTKITVDGNKYTVVGKAIGARTVAKDDNGEFVIISHDNILLKKDVVKEKVKQQNIFKLKKI